MRLHAVLGFTAALCASAQAAEPPAAVIDEIVVTASTREQKLTEAPASISVVTTEQLAQRPNADLTEALRDVEGISITGGSNTQDIYVRGLPGSYTLILVDGKRQSTRDTRVNGNAGFEQSFTPPTVAIERIEVVRGPMSSLYGSDAIGGVINIITRKVPERWGGTCKPLFDDANRPGGGADLFLDLIEQKIKPRAEALTTVDPNRRTLWGHSYGGLLTLYAAFTRPNSFQRFVAASPSLWWNYGAILERESTFVTSAHPQAMRLDLMAGELEQRPRSNVSAMRTSLPPGSTRSLAERLKSAGVNVIFTEFPGLGHGPMFEASLARTLRDAASP
jgi:hypothetical protein